MSITKILLCSYNSLLICTKCPVTGNGNSNQCRKLSARDCVTLKVANNLLAENSCSKVEKKYTLNNHLMILLNGPDIQDFNFEKAYEHWTNKKKELLFIKKFFDDDQQMCAFFM